ncbi:MAG: hypothetical protein JNK60_14120, partial [Acidobacteria bacterium]|nr:hypothetical protein [Acidobacteriota bacterium]
HLNRLDAPAGSVSIAPSLQADGRTIVLNPAANLAAEGEYEILLDAVKDSAGNPLLAPIRIPFFTRDDAAPVATLDAPDTLTPYESTFHTYTVRWTADDVKTVAIALVTAVGQQQLTTFSPPRADRARSQSLGIPRLGAAGGPLVLVRAVLTDLSGNTSQIVEQPLTIQADLPPAIASAAIEGSASVARNATFTLVVSGTDDTELSLFEVTPPAGVTFLSSSTSGTPTNRTDRYNYRVNLSAAAGPAVFAVKARDRLLQYSPVSNVTLTVLDDASPTVTIVSPTSGSFLSGSSIPVQLVVGDDLGVATLRLTLGASVKDLASPAGTVSTTITAPTVATSGTVQLTAAVTDTTGHVTAVSVNLTIQPDAPPTIAVTAPAANAHFTTGTTISVTGTLTDDNGSATLLATFAGSTRSASSVGGFALTFTAPNVAVPTSLDLVLTAQDNTGHAATPVTVPVVIDPDTISPTVSVATPAEAQDVVGGTLFVLVATASDNVAVKTFRYRIAGGSWISVPGATVSTTVLAPAVASNTNLAIELEATDYADRVTALTRTVRVVPNLAPVVAITQPTAGRRITAGTVYTVSGTVTDDSGTATVTATDGTASPSAQAPSGTWSFPFTAPTVSAETPLTLSVTARDPQNVTSTPRTVVVTIVPDVGGTPTVTLAPPAPSVLLVGTTTGVPILFADNVGLSSGTAEVTGPFASAGVQTYSLSGLSATRTVPVTFTSRPFGESSRVVAQNVDLGGRAASLDVSLPVAYHRLETALAAGPYLEGGTIAGTFRISAEGRARASLLKLEIGTVGAGGFTTLTCVQRSAPLAELETLTVTVPSGQTGLYLRSVLVESTTGLVAPAARADGLGLFLDAIATTADATAPGLVISSPTAGDTFPSGSLVTVSATATDNVRVASIDVTFDGITKSCAGGSCNVTFWAPTVVTSTAMTITVTARDGGNRTDVKTVSVTITAGGGVASEAPPEPVVRGDGQPPRLKVLAPALEDSPVAPGAPFTPVVEASDADGIATVTYVLEGLGEPVACLVQKAGRASASEACHVPEVPEGTRLTLRIVAVDRTGETSEEVASLVVRNGVRLSTKQTLRGDDRDLTGRIVYVESDVELRGAMDVETLIVRPFASLRPVAGEALRVRAANDVVIETLGTLEASALGAPGARSDRATDVFTPPGAGGAHGGNGGETPAFDSPFVPSLPGAGGGFDALHAIPGGTGGGVIDLLATRILVAGHVRADGEESISVGAGAGAGGTLRLTARREIRTQEARSLSLSGFLSVRGGPVPEGAPVRALAGGGRIALEAPEVSVPLYDVSGSVTPSSRGAAGSLFVRDDERPRGVLVLDGGAPEGVPVAATHMPSVGCGLVAEGRDGSLRANRPLSLGLAGLLLEIGRPVVRVLRVASNDTSHLWLDVPKGDPVLTLLSGQPYCGVLQLDELHLLGGAHAAFPDRLDVAPREIHVDSTSTLEKP